MKNNFSVTQEQQTQHPQPLLDKGYIKVGSKSYVEYWKKGDEIIEVFPNVSDVLKDTQTYNIQVGDLVFNKNDKHQTVGSVKKILNPYTYLVEYEWWSSGKHSEQVIEHITSLIRCINKA